MDAAPPNAPPVPKPPAEDWFIGQLVEGKYRVERLIASGGMGRVYKGTQEPLGRPVAIKILAPVNPGATSDEVHEKRFFREASIASRLSHPNTVVIHDYGALPEGRGFFIIMEFIGGGSLYEVISHEGPLPASRALHIARQICGSLAEAHGHGVVHRDLKPLNILLTGRGHEGDFVKVVDFGLVKSVDEEVSEVVTQEGQIIGSPLYMSPEQIFSQDVDARADIYAFGVILYEMLTGRPPFVRTGKKKDFSEIIRAHLTLPPPPMRTVLPSGAPEVPEAIERLVQSCLAKNPDERPASMKALGEQLARLAETAAAEARASQRPAATTPAPTASASSSTTTNFSMDRVLAAVPDARVALQPIPSHVETHAATAPTARRSPAKVAAVTATALALAAALAVALWPTAPPETRPPTATVARDVAPPAPVAPAQPAAEAAPPEPSSRVAEDAPPLSSEVVVHFVTTPPGATVSEGDEVLGTTPFELEAPRAALAEAPRTFLVRLPGYVAHSHTLGATLEPEVTVRLTLEPAPEAEPPPEPAPPAAAEPVAEPVAPAPTPRKAAPPRKKGPKPLDIKMDR